MYARVLTIPMKSGVFDEATNIYENSIVPAIQKQPGSKGATLMGNTDMNTAISITYWETEADMLAGEASSYLQTELAKVGSLFAGSPVNMHYEVSVQV